MNISLHIAPVGLGPCYNQSNCWSKRMFLWAKPKAQFVTGPSPIPTLTCPDTPELGLLRSRPAQSMASAMDFSPDRRSAVSVLRRAAASQHPGYCDAAFRDAAFRDAAFRCNMQASFSRLRPPGSVIPLSFCQYTDSPLRLSYDTGPQFLSYS